MKRQTIVSALALVGTLVFAGCGGGGAGSASANGCGGGGYGGSGTVYPANVAYSVPFSSQTVSGTLQFPADQSCHQVSASASTALPSGASAVPAGAGESVLTIITAHIAGDWNTQVPTTITFPLPTATLAGKTFSVYYASDYPAGQWEHIDYVGSVSWSDSLTLTSGGVSYTGLGNNYFAITSR